MTPLSNLQKEELQTKAQANLKNTINQATNQISILQDRITRKEMSAKEISSEIHSGGYEGIEQDFSNWNNLLDESEATKTMITKFNNIKNSPYFTLIEYIDDKSIHKSIYVGKFDWREANIFSWVSPISQLRFSPIGIASYTTPAGEKRMVRILTKQHYLINNGELIFMTHESEDTGNQVILQKYMPSRSGFYLPEIVSKLDKLQDEIIRSTAYGTKLIAGPAGSGKTTLALHRIAYLLLNPEYQDHFQSENMIVFVSDDRAINYFGQLLPELGIQNVKLTTFQDWALSIVNTRFRNPQQPRFELVKQHLAIEVISQMENLPLSPETILNEVYRLKFIAVKKLYIGESNSDVVHQTLRELYFKQSEIQSSPIIQLFTAYLNWQQSTHTLDVADLTFLLTNTRLPLKTYVHVVVDEVQNLYLPQLKIISNLVDPKYNSISLVGDIKQHTFPFSIHAWEEIDFLSPQKFELEHTYRSPKEITSFLKQLGYDIEIGRVDLQGGEVSRLNYTHSDDLLLQIQKIIRENANSQIGILAKEIDQLDGIEHLGYTHDNVHVSTIRQAQGLEFGVVIMIDADELLHPKDKYKYLGDASSEYTYYDKQLFYVGATRSQQKLFIFDKDK